MDNAMVTVICVVATIGVTAFGLYCYVFRNW